MKRTITVMALLCTHLIARGATLQSTFNTDAEGWTANTPDGAANWINSGGNPGGFLRIEEGGGIAENFAAVAPVAFLGNLSLFNGGTLSFDVIILDTGTGVFDSLVGTTTLTSPFGNATLDLIPDEPPMSWKNYLAPLTAAAWGKTQTEWDSILSNVTGIAIDLEGYTGPDVTGFDNFAIVSAVPEPSSLMLLVIAGFSLAGRRALHRNRQK